MERYFFIPKKGDVAYLSIPKSGCTSIKLALSDSRLLSKEKKGYSVHNKDDYGFLFLAVVSESASCLNGLFKFTFVRDPIERVYSFYRNKIKIYDPNVTPYYENMG